MAPANIIIRLKRPEDDAFVAELIFESLNVWYKKKLGVEQVVSSPASSSIYTRIYDALDPNCCVVAEDAETGKIAGSCFFHPRPTHVALGIMTVSPEFFGRGVASKLLAYIVDVAERRNQPLRLVSSAMNLDSFSLYNRVGFVPNVIFQDMSVAVPEEGFEIAPPIGMSIRDARFEDVPALVELEREIYGVDREKDFRFFIENEHNIWGVSVLVDDATGAICGYAASVNEPGSTTMLGPGAARTERQMGALIRAELNRYRGAWSPIFLIPVDAKELRYEMYALGAKNTEVHLGQARGEVPPRNGIVLPTFMPETA